MKKDIEFFTKVFRDQMQKNKSIGHANIPYGNNVIPILEMYKGLSEYVERKAFEDAIELMLTDQAEGKRRFAVTVCLGFVAFRDVT